jgi:hypothetical protein
VKLLLDEMLAPQIARLLRDHGHDAVAIKERAEWMAYRDDQVMEVARQEQRAIVTNNIRDYRPLAAVATLPNGAGHYGLVFVPSSYRRTRADIGRIVEALEQSLAAHPGTADCHNRETWLS